MSREAALTRGRAFAEQGMADQCQIRRVVSETTDPASGVITPTYTTIYAGPCRLQHGEAQAREQTNVGQQYLLMLVLELQLPMSVTGLQVDDQVTVTASALDADLVGRVFAIRDLFHKTHATSRRLRIQERTS